MMKYLTYEDPELGIVFVAFSGSLSHDDVASNLGKGRKGTRSAGFISLTSTGLYCHGESQSLGIGSLLADSKLATAFFKI